MCSGGREWGECMVEGERSKCECNYKTRPELD